MASRVSAQQRSDEERREQFLARALNLVSRMESAGAFVFWKRATKSMVTEVVQGPFAYALEFPTCFLHQHSKKFGFDATFVTDSQRTWPIKVTVRHYKHSNPRVFAYGAGGWKTFLMDNHVQVGDVLVFVLVRWSTFQVYIGRASAEVHADEHHGSN